MHLGFSTSGILAIMFMDKLESALSHTTSSAHTRYMQMTSSFKQPMKNLHPRLKPEIKRPTFSSEGLSLSLLALKVTLSENSKKLLGKIQKKGMKKPLFVHHQSVLPRNSKINFICNEQRCRVCSRDFLPQTAFNKHDCVLDNILPSCEYPETVMKKSQCHHQQNLQIS